MCKICTTARSGTQPHDSGWGEENELGLLRSQGGQGGIVRDHCQVVLGKKLAMALGIDDIAMISEPTCLYQEGRYSNNGVSDLTGVLRLGMVHVAMDIVCASIFGNRQENVVHTMDPTHPNSYDDNDFHNLMESPLTSTIISFLDDKGEVIHFCQYSSADFLFSLVFQFKRMTLI